MMKSNENTSRTPSAYSSSTDAASEDLATSGTAVGARPANVASLYSRKHLPGRSRPARPARCRADAREMGCASRLASSCPPSDACVPRCLASPASTTKTMPPIVSDVSAMFVARIALRAPPGSPERKLLLRGRQRGEERADQQRPRGRREEALALSQRRLHRLDVLLPRQEDEHISIGFVEVDLNDGRHRGLEVVHFGLRRVQELHRVRAADKPTSGCAAEEFAEEPDVERRRHDDQPQRLRRENPQLLCRLEDPEQYVRL